MQNNHKETFCNWKDHLLLFIWITEMLAACVYNMLLIYVGCRYSKSMLTKVKVFLILLGLLLIIRPIMRAISGRQHLTSFLDFVVRMFFFCIFYYLVFMVRFVAIQLENIMKYM